MIKIHARLTVITRTKHARYQDTHDIRCSTFWHYTIISYVKEISIISVRNINPNQIDLLHLILAFYFARINIARRKTWNFYISIYFSLSEKIPWHSAFIYGQWHVHRTSKTNTVNFFIFISAAILKLLWSLMTFIWGLLQRAKPWELPVPVAITKLHSFKSHQ